MNRIQKNVKLICILTLLTMLLGVKIAFTTGSKEIRKYSIPDHGVLELNVPATWQEKVHKAQENLPPTIIFNPASETDFQVIITLFWSKKGEQGFNSADKVRKLVDQEGKKLLPQAVETKILLKEIKGTNNNGYYFSLTDKAPNPGEYRYMTRGGIGVGNLLLSLTVLHRVKDSESVEAALSALREAKQIAK